MARIRSVHPGLFTDEDFVELSPEAALFWIGLLTECDDQGAFDWKPSTLKMRLRPSSVTRAETLLDELVKVDKVKRIEVDGRAYGLVRNFRKFQRPKKPNAIYPVPNEHRAYVGFGSEPEAPSRNHGSEPELRSRKRSSEPAPPSSEASSPPVGKLVEQMEDGGGRMKDGGEDGGSSSESPNPALSAAARARSRGNSLMTDDWQPGAEDLEWLAGARPDVTEAVRLDQTDRFRNHHIARASTSAAWGRDWRNWMRRTPAVEAAKPGTSAATDEGAQWRARLRTYQPGGFWNSFWGPRPEQKGCHVPPAILAEWRERHPAAVKPAA